MFGPDIPLWAAVATFVAAAAVIGLAGVKTAELADRVADRSGLGEALTGTLFLGFITALPGLVASVVAALQGNAGLAVGNALGGIAVQTAALALADIAYRKANLEHAAASLANMMQSIMLILMLTLALAAFTGPDRRIFHVHYMSLFLFAAGGLAFWLTYRTGKAPMWKPTQTTETVEDVPAPGHEKRTCSN